MYKVTDHVYCIKVHEYLSFVDKQEVSPQEVPQDQQLPKMGALLAIKHHLVPPLDNKGNQRMFKMIQK